MRVISQWSDVDVDYESSTFMIIEKEFKDGIKRHTIIAIPHGTDLQLVMAGYSDLHMAQIALKEMSSNYVRYLVTDTSNTMTMTDALDCELDKPFNRIEIQEMKATVYRFPEEA